MRVLFFGDSVSMYFRNLLRWLQAYYPDISADIVTRENAGIEDLPVTEHIIPGNSYLSGIPKIRSLQSLFGIRRIVSAMDEKEKYDIIHILGADPALALLARSLQKRTGGIITTIYGDDFYRTSAFVRSIQKSLYRASDRITLNNSQTISEFNEHYKSAFADKIRLLRFGIAPVDAMKQHAARASKARSMLEISENTIVVAIGTNGFPGQRHESIIRSIAAHRDRLPGNVLFLLPMTYGCDERYREKIAALMASCDLKDFRVLSRFLSDEEVAMFRYSTDILLQLQITDQLSGAMQEQLYAGGLVITGAWLPYEPFDERGVFMLKAKSIEEAGSQLVKAIANLDELKRRCASNVDVIWEMSSWEANIKTWLSLYEEALDHRPA